MVNIEEFKLAHKDQLLTHSILDITLLFGKFYNESEYTIMQMENYLFDIKHIIDQGLDVSMVSHLTYNLNLQLLHCYNRTKEYYDASRYYLLGEHGRDIHKRINEYQEKSREIKELVKNLDEISIFNIYCAHPADFLGSDHYNKGLKGKNLPLIRLERELSFMNGVQLLNCLLYLMELAESKLLDIRNGITYESNETLELIYNLNCVFFADNYWIDESYRYRTSIATNDLMDEVSPAGLQDCYQQLLKDFKTNETGMIWAENAASISDLAYELKRKNLSTAQWEYFFRTVFRLEELKRWKMELKNSKSPSKRKSKEKPKIRETMTFKRNNSVLDGHLTLLFDKMKKEGWIDGNEADFKALFSGKRDEDCILTWMGPFGKAALYTLFSTLEQKGYIILPKGYAISAILEGHFKDKSGQWLSGLDKGNRTNDKALPFISECLKLLKTDPKGYYDDEEDSSTVYDPYDHQDLQLHKR